MKTRVFVFAIVLILATVIHAQQAQTVTKVAAGEYHSLFLKNDGSLWAMGNNSNGQLGDGTFGTYPTYGTNLPEQIVASGVTAIAAGGFPGPTGNNHSLFLKSDGSLWAMGGNFSGQLGDGTYNSTNQPQQIVASGVAAIAAGRNHSLFLKSDGSLWAMGDNSAGQLGDGTTDNGNYETNLPEQIVASGVTAIAAGAWYSLFLKSDGSLWAMGENYYGQLGDGTFATYGTNLPEQIVAKGVTAIAAGGFHSLFLKSDGSLWAMGANESGELGDGTYNTTNLPEQIVASGVTAIAAGGYPTACFSRAMAVFGRWVATFLANWATAPTTAPINPSRLWPAGSRRLPQEDTTACFSRTTAVCGPWATTALASWATALTTTPTFPSRLWLVNQVFPASAFRVI